MDADEKRVRLPVRDRSPFLQFHEVIAAPGHHGVESRRLQFRLQPLRDIQGQVFFLHVIAGRAAVLPAMPGVDDDRVKSVGGIGDAGGASRQEKGAEQKRKGLEKSAYRHEERESSGPRCAASTPAHSKSRARPFRGALHVRASACERTESPRRARNRPTFSSTPTIPSIGFPGARRRLKKRAARRSRSFFRSAIPPATGATSWSANRSRTRTRRGC